MFDLGRFGLDSKALQSLDSFKPSATGSVLLLDGDGGVYESATVAKLSTALRRFENHIYTQMFLAGCDRAIVHLTPDGCAKNGRHLLKTVKPYQENREGKVKPPFVHALRSEKCLEYFATNDDIKIVLNYDIEADDALMIDHYRMQNGVLISADKDLNLSPYKSYNVTKGVFEVLPEGDKFGWIDREDWLTPTGKPAYKITGKGTKFFMAQLLMGDTADNVQGIIKLDGKLCGGVGAYNALDPIKDADEAMNFIVDAYKAIDQNIIPEAEAMWLLRTPQDTAFKFITEHNLTDSNLNYVNECFYEREWRITHD